MKYNGTSLSALPGYDRQGYPCACIAESSLLPGVYTLYICSEPFWYSAEKGNVRTQVGARLCTSQYDADTNSWGAVRNTDSIAGTVGLTPIWCSPDILDESGGVYLAGSEPVWEPLEIRRHFGCVSWLIGFALGMAGRPNPDREGADHDG